MYSIKLAFVEFFCTIKNARHFFLFLNRCITYFEYKSNHDGSGYPHATDRLYCD